MYLELSTTGDAVDTEVQPKRFDLGVPVSSVVERFVCPYRLTVSFGFGVVSASRSPSMNCKPARSTRGDAHRHVHRTPSNVTESHRHHRGHGGQEGQTYSKTRFFLRVPGVLRGGELDSAMRSLEAAGNRIVGCGRPLYSTFNGKGSLLYRLSSLYQVRTKAWWPPAGGLLAFDAAQATLGAQSKGARGRGRAA